MGMRLCTKTLENRTSKAPQYLLSLVAEALRELAALNHLWLSTVPGILLTLAEPVEWLMHRHLTVRTSPP